MDDTKQQLSALMDGALEDEEILSVVDALATEPELQAAWSEYHLIGDTLRAQGAPAVEVTERVMAAIKSIAPETSGADAAPSLTPPKPHKPHKPLSM